MKSKTIFTYRQLTLSNQLVFLLSWEEYSRVYFHLVCHDFTYLQQAKLSTLIKNKSALLKERKILCVMIVVISAFLIVTPMASKGLSRLADVIVRHVIRLMSPSLARIVNL